MIKLYGIGLSNYYNMVKLSLTEKGLDFEEVMAEPSQEADYTSVMQKVIQQLILLPGLNACVVLMYCIPWAGMRLGYLQNNMP